MLSLEKFLNNRFQKLTEQTRKVFWPVITGSLVVPFIKIGVTFAVLHSSGSLILNF
jgi:hypothetical protein